MQGVQLLRRCHGSRASGGNMNLRCCHDSCDSTDLQACLIAYYDMFMKTGCDGLTLLLPCRRFFSAPRPLSYELLQYAASDVRYLVALVMLMTRDMLHVCPGLLFPLQQHQQPLL